MTFKIGKITITINDIRPGTDHDKLQKDIIESLPAEMIKNAHLIEFPEGEETHHAVVNA